MKFKFLSIIRSDYGKPFEHTFSFMVTAHGAGFIIDTPSYSTGMRATPFSAIGDYIRFCCKRDEKATFNGL